jgi:hypothetical protein
MVLSRQVDTCSIGEGLLPAQTTLCLLPAYSYPTGGVGSAKNSTALQSPCWPWLPATAAV